MRSLAFNSKISNTLLKRSFHKTLAMNGAERVYGGAFNIYKSRAAVAIKPILPSFKNYQATTTNTMGQSKTLAREGNL
jgi:hypothetical protein